MKVYILTAYCSELQRGFEGTFSSLSALLSYLKSNYDYESTFEEYRYEGFVYGLFKETCKLDYFYDMELRYEVHDIIGEHCSRTGCLKLD